MTLAYLGTPYTKYRAGLNAAFYDACRLTARLVASGVKCFSPIVHGHAISTHSNLDPLDLGIWYLFNDLMMDRCDVLIVAHLDGWDESDGIAYEIKAFERSHRPIFDLDPESLKMVRRTLPWGAVA
jgi:hypothetical protein